MPLESEDRTSVGVQSVERALDLLESLATHETGLGVRDLSQITGLPNATIHRLLRTMVERGYVRQDSSRKYSLGTALIRLGDRAGRAFGVTAQPYLARLVSLSGETANLAMLEGDKVVYVAQVPSQHSMRLFAEVGRHVLPHCTAVGKVLLSHRSNKDTKAIIDRIGLPARTQRTITDSTIFFQELAQVRGQGFAIDDGEEEVGVRCIAVPVMAGTSCLAAMSVSGPEGRFRAETFERLIADMHEVAQDFASTFLSTGADSPSS